MEPPFHTPPVALVCPASAGQQLAYAPAAVTRQRVVVVDDNFETLDLLRDILTEHEYDVEVAPAVDAGLHEIRDARPDLIIVDLLLSTDQRWLSGWDVVRLARSHAELHRLPIIQKRPKKPSPPRWFPPATALPCGRASTSIAASRTTPRTCAT